MSPIEIDYSIGITVFMPDCSFQAEISRQIIPKTIADIDAELAEEGCSDDDESRISAAIWRSMVISSSIADGKIDQEYGVTEIAYSFVYAYVKKSGLESLADLEGIVGCLAEDSIYLNPCVDRKSFEEASEVMRQSAATVMGYDDAVDITPPKPTIH